MQELNVALSARDAAVFDLEAAKEIADRNASAMQSQLDDLKDQLSVSDARVQALEAAQGSESSASHALQKEVKRLKESLGERDAKINQLELSSEHGLLEQRERLEKKYEYDIALIRKEASDAKERLGAAEASEHAIRRECEQAKYEWQTELMKMRDAHEEKVSGLISEHSDALEAKENTIKDLESKVRSSKRTSLLVQRWLKIVALSYLSSTKLPHS